MKRLLNVIAFIIIVGLVGSWECGNCDFRTLLFNAGTVLYILMLIHILRIVLKFMRHNKKVRKNNVIIS